MEFLKELNVIKAAAELVNRQKQAYKEHVHSQREGIAAFLLMLSTHSSTSDLAAREKLLTSLAPLPFSSFPDPVHENAHLLASQETEVENANKKAAEVLKDTQELIAKKEEERRVLEERQRKGVRDHLDKQKARLDECEKALNEAAEKEDPFLKQEVLASIRVAFLNYRGVMPDGDGELQTQKQRAELLAEKVASALE